MTARPLTPLHNAALALTDQLPAAYTAPIMRLAGEVEDALDYDAWNATGAVAELLDELAEALTTRARVA